VTASVQICKPLLNYGMADDLSKGSIPCRVTKFQAQQKSGLQMSIRAMVALRMETVQEPDCGRSHDLSLKKIMHPRRSPFWRRIKRLTCRDKFGDCGIRLKFLGERSQLELTSVWTSANMQQRCILDD